MLPKDRKKTKDSWIDFDIKLVMQVSFMQANLKNGKFERVFKTIQLNDSHGIQLDLSPREFIDNSDTLGFINLDGKD